MFQEFEGYDFCDICPPPHKVLMGQYLFQSIKSNRTIMFQDFAMVIWYLNSGYTVLLSCSVHGSDKLLPRYWKIKKFTFSQKYKRLPTTYEATTDSWITTSIFEDYHTELERKLGAKNAKPCFSLMSVLPTLRTYFSTTVKLYFSQLIVPASCSLYIWGSFLHSSAIIESD
jgi:hypothetical protein